MDALTVNPLSIFTVCLRQGEKSECGLRLLEEAHVKVPNGTEPTSFQRSAEYSFFVFLLTCVMLLGHASYNNDASRPPLPVTTLARYKSADASLSR